MLSFQEKERINKKVEFLKLGQRKNIDEGRTIRVVHTLYNDSLEKKGYLVYKIATQNPILAAKCIKDLPKKQELEKEIENSYLIWGINAWKNSLVPIIVNFYLGNYMKMVQLLREFDLEYSNKYNCENVIKEICDNIASKKDYLYFLLVCIAEDALPDELLSQLLCDGVDGSVQLQDDIRAILLCLEKKKKFNLYVQVIEKIGIEKAINIFEINIIEYVEKLNGLPIETKMKKELEVYTFLDDSAADVYNKYRKKYREFLPSGLKYYVTSYFNEYIENKISFDAFLVELFELKDIDISMKILKSEEMFFKVLKVIEKAVYEKQDSRKLLKGIEKINLSKINNDKFIPYAQISFSVNNIKNAEKLVDFLIENYSIHETLNLYFNTCIKFIIEIQTFLKKTNNYHGTELLNRELSQFLIPGKIKYDADGGVMIGLLNIKSNALFFCKEEHYHGFTKEGKVWAILTVYRQYGYIKGAYCNEKDRDVPEAHKWNRCLEILNDLAQSDCEEINQHTFEEIKYYSNVKMCEMENRLDELMDILYRIAARRVVFKQILIALAWTRYFIYTNEKKMNTVDYSLYLPYEEMCLRMLHTLLCNHIDVSDLISIYMNTFLRVTVSLWEFVDIAVEFYDPDVVKRGFEKYVFRAIYRKESMYSYLYSVKWSGTYRLEMPVNINSKKEIRYIVDKIDIVNNYIDFKMINTCEVEDDTNEQVLGEMLRRFNVLAEKKCSIQVYNAITCVDSRRFSDNEEVCLKIHESLRSAIHLRRHKAKAIAKMLKDLSFHNIYCARTYFYLKNSFIREFQAIPEDITNALSVLDIIVRNSQRLNDCFFIYINSFIKQNISIKDFFALCEKQGVQEGGNFSVSFYAYGKILQKENNSNRIFKATNMRFDDLPINGINKDIENDTEVVAYIKIHCKDKNIEFEIQQIKKVTDLFADCCR